MAFLLFAGFLLQKEILPQLKIKAMLNVKTKSPGIILTLWAMFVPITRFLLFLVSEVECGKHVLFFWLFLDFLSVFTIFATDKTFSRNLSAHNIPVIDANFVPNLTFLSLLSPKISFREKTVSHSDRDPPGLFSAPH